MFAEQSSVLHVVAQLPTREVPQGWVGVAAVAAGAIMAAIALVKRGREVSLARRQRRREPSSSWSARGGGSRRGLANGPLR